LVLVSRGTRRAAARDVQTIERCRLFHSLLVRRVETGSGDVGGGFGRGEKLQQLPRFLRMPRAGGMWAA